MSKKSITTRSSLMKRTTALVLAIATGAIVATAGSAAPTARSGALHVTKQCSDPRYDGSIGSYCTIVSSNIPAIQPDMRVVYLAPLGDGELDSDLALGSGQGTALGHVVLNTNTFQGRISFSVGTGRFRGFQANAAVSVDKDGIWHWDGRYRFDR